MALPTRGQHDWDDELGNHISGLEADAQSAKANADAAISAANNALNVAQAVQGAVLGGSDVATAGLIADGASATKAALSAAYVAPSAKTTSGPAAPMLYINPLDTGAFGNGTANNDTAGIQAAIDAAAAAGGGVVRLPKRDFSVTQLRMKSKVTLQGSGWGTRIIQRTGTNDGAGIPKHLIVLDSVSVEHTVVSDLTLHGNKDNQTTANDCLNYDNTAGSFSFYDPNHIIQRVLCYIPRGNGITLSANSRESKVSDVFVTGAVGYGYDISATDSVFVNCTAGAAGKSAWRLRGPNTRLVNCKGFGSGTLGTGGDAYGFFISSRRVSLTGCEAQDNYQHGFLVGPSMADAMVTLTGCIADSNATGAAGSGFRLDGVSKVMLTGCLAFDRQAAGSRTQRYGLEVAGTSSTLDITIACQDNVTGNYTGAPTASRIFVNAAAV